MVDQTGSSGDLSQCLGAGPADGATGEAEEGRGEWGRGEPLGTFGGRPEGRTCGNGGGGGTPEPEASALLDSSDASSEGTDDSSCSSASASRF